MPAPSLLLRYPDPSTADRRAMTANRSLDAIIAALGAILMVAPERERRRLAQAIEHYAARFPIAYRDMRNGHPAPALRELIEEVIEAVDARPEDKLKDTAWPQ